jgi:hypothetical protein
MVLLFESFRGFAIIELTFTFAPVGNIAIVGRFLSFDVDVDMVVLRIRNIGESFIE